MPFEVVPRFIPGTASSIFLVEYVPEEERGCVIVVPAFAEEMNRSRPMVARLARALAGRGYRVMIPDLAGTGDSPGEFGDATWQAWQGDISAVLSLAGDPSRVSLVCLRLGALLAADFISAGGCNVRNLVLWSPCLKGNVFMQQFLRLRTVSAMVGKSGAGESIAELKESLANGQAIEVAGYDITPVLYVAIAGADLKVLAGRINCPIHWFEMVANDGAALPAAAKPVLGAFGTAGMDVSTDTIAGPKFWSTVETTFSDTLIERTSRIIAGKP